MNNAFLHGGIKENVYAEQPPGYQNKDDRDKVYKLEKFLYGLK